MEKDDFSNIIGEIVQTHNGMSYYCQDVVGEYAFIIATNTNTRVKHWEVFRLRRHSNKRVSNKWRVKFPSNEDFGSYGWSCSEEKNAIEIFNTIYTMKNGRSNYKLKGKWKYD